MSSPTSFAPLTRNQVTLLKKSFRNLNAPLVAEKFYAKLFEKYPEVKQLFPADMDELGGKLMSVFELVVFSFDEKQHDQFTLQDSVIMPLRQLGRKHDEKGIEPKHYAIANDLLLETMHETASDIFTDEVTQSWKLALSQLTEAMLNKKINPSAQVEKESGLTLRETFSYIRKRLLKQPD
jgi:nitric oxide dioxygenase